MSIKIINRAFFKLGQNPISSVNQEPFGSMAGIVYENCRDTLLSSHPWRFAIKRAELAPDDETPAFGYKYQYTIPSDCLLFIDINDVFKIPNLTKLILTKDERFSIESGKILARESQRLYIVYVQKIEDTNNFSAIFKEALSTYIASELCLRITANAQLKSYLDKEFQTWLLKAQENNEIICDSVTMPDNSWVTSREGWRINDATR